MTSNTTTMPAAIARDILEAHAARRQIAPFTTREAGLSLEDAYAAGLLVRAERIRAGARPVGRKIGFTNRTIWEEYGVYAPIWGAVYDTTLVEGAGRETVEMALDAFLEPRIEPEIVLRLGRAPRPGMDEAALLGCVEAVAHGFEIVQSLYPDWRFAAADTVCAFALHGALVTGPFVAIPEDERETWCAGLAGLTATLVRGGVVVDEGRAENVLGGGPIAALAHLVGVLADQPDAPPLEAGEIVSTGTLTRALPVAPGETWSSRIGGVPLTAPALRFL